MQLIPTILFLYCGILAVHSDLMLATYSGPSQKVANFIPESLTNLVWNTLLIDKFEKHRKNLYPACKILTSKLPLASY